MVRLLGGLAITVLTLYCSPRVRTGKGRGREGSGLYPELAAYRISEGASPNVQAEVGRLVALLPIEPARAEAVFQLRAAVLSGRWGEILDQTREAMARDRRTEWHWEPPACLAELKTLDDGDEISTQPSTKKHSKRTAA